MPRTSMVKFGPILLSLLVMLCERGTGFDRAMEEAVLQQGTFLGNLTSKIIYTLDI